MVERSDLAERIRHRLAEKGMPASAASRAAGLSETFVRDIYRNPTRSPRVESLARLAEVLGCTVRDLLPEDEATAAAEGMTEPVSIWSPKSTDPFHADFDTAISALFPSGRHRSYLKANVALPGLNIGRGDVIVMDLNAKHGVGDLVVVNSHDPSSSRSTTLLCRYVPPYLVDMSAALSSTPLLADSDRNAIMGLVLGIVRSPDL